ncbi:MAG: hypothetical protein NTW21_44395 [Verrucomicrobia bacterium]|nr:hypothetical protein [Verrucomicrobiota bacterium]
MRIDTPRVIVFDDNAILRDALAKNLRDRGIDADTYDNPNAAIMAVNSKLYTAGVLDIVDKSSEPGGLAIADQLMKVNRSARIFMVSVYGHYEDAVTERGLPLYIKPIYPQQMDEICAAIKEELISPMQSNGTRVIDVIGTVEESDEFKYTLSFDQPGVGWMLIDLDRRLFATLKIVIGSRIRVSCIVDQDCSLCGIWIPNSPIVNDGGPSHPDFISFAERLEPPVPVDFQDAQGVDEYRKNLIELFGRSYDT